MHVQSLVATACVAAGAEPVVRIDTMVLLDVCYCSAALAIECAWHRCNAGITLAIEYRGHGLSHVLSFFRHGITLAYLVYYAWHYSGY